MKNWMLIIVFIMIACASAIAKDNDIVAMTILGEARGEGKQGMYAVACVINQRAINRKMTPAQVCLQRKQFSCWNSKNKTKLKSLLNSPQGQYAKILADNIRNLKCDYVKYADHYCTLNTNNYWT